MIDLILLKYDLVVGRSILHYFFISFVVVKKKKKKEEGKKERDSAILLKMAPNSAVLHYSNDAIYPIFLVSALFVILKKSITN
jgi:hypothetical protein